MGEMYIQGGQGRSCFMDRDVGTWWVYLWPVFGLFLLGKMYGRVSSRTLVVCTLCEGAGGDRCDLGCGGGGFFVWLPWLLWLSFVLWCFGCNNFPHAPPSPADLCSILSQPDPSCALSKLPRDVPVVHFWGLQFGNVCVGGNGKSLSWGL
mmetsp:Transcript_18886/g.31674  ORF Transcript_18886/g.31674 Transcript_18886/m.31674 type:complete len:150 (-) Transcript_18886:25-474(-)